MTSDFERFSIPDFIDYIYFPILILEKEPVFGMTLSLTGDWTCDLLAVEASTLPLGYRGGDTDITEYDEYTPCCFVTGKKDIWIYENFEKGDITLEPFGRAGPHKKYAS